VKTSLRRLLPLLVAALLTAGALAWAAPRLMHRFYTHGLKVVTVVQGLDTPWAMAFLPDGRLLVTERPGRMRLVTLDGHIAAPLAGLPPVWAQGEGGLMDVVLDPHFSDNRRVYWSYAEPDATGAAAGTAVARGRLEADRLVDVQVIYRQPQKGTDGRHFGSRLLFDREGRLFVGLGDRMRRAEAQDLGSAHGKILRLDADGGAPADNPFAHQPGALPQVWSYGHRNVQGLAWHPQTGELWATEHGPSGGDELNLIQRGHNHGWPVITHGCEYSTCARIGEGTAKAGMDQPVLWWGPESTPPSALLFVTSDRYPDWQGQLLVATFRNGAFTRVKLDGHRVVEKEAIYLAGNGRVRDLKQGPDGWIYVLANVPDGRIVRVER
jgi:aldose sugar dehydrogenase